MLFVWLSLDKICLHRQPTNKKVTQLYLNDVPYFESGDISALFISKLGVGTFGCATHSAIALCKYVSICWL